MIAMKKTVLLALSTLLALGMISCKDSVKDEVWPETHLVKRMEGYGLDSVLIQKNEYFYDDENRLIKQLTDGKVTKEVTYLDHLIRVIAIQTFDDVDYRFKTDYILKDNRIIKSILYTSDTGEAYAEKIFEYNDRNQLVNVVSTTTLDEIQGMESVYKKVWDGNNVSREYVVDEFFNMDFSYTDLPDIVNYNPDDGIELGFKGKRSKNLVRRVDGTDFGGQPFVITCEYVMDREKRPVQITKTGTGEETVICHLYY